MPKYEGLKPVIEQPTQNIPALRRHLRPNAHSFPINYKDGNTPRQYNPLPEVFYLRGNSELLNANVRRIAIVGTRKPLWSQLEIASKLGRFMSEHDGIVTVSGLAIGIDAQAHSTSNLNIAVLPGYPSEAGIRPRTNTSIANTILQKNGLLLSENRTEVVEDFQYVQRDRLVSALSDKVIIVGGDIDSGTAHTARVAWVLGQPLGVVDPRDLGEDSENPKFALNKQLLSFIGTPNQRGIFRITAIPDGGYDDHVRIWESQILGMPMEG